MPITKHKTNMKNTNPQNTSDDKNHALSEVYGILELNGFVNYDEFVYTVEESTEAQDIVGYYQS